MRPEVALAIKGNRLKLYGDKYYMDDGTEFEFLFHNKTSDVYGAKISINNKLISSSMLVLRPGESVRLERYLDTPQKFIFNTYKVSKDSAEFIKDNGLIKIDFYKEVDKNLGDWFIYKPVCPTISPWGVNEWPKTEFYYDSKTNITFPTTSVNNNSINTFHVCDTSSPIETGRIELGNKSNQHLANVQCEFQSFSTFTNIFQILPKSQKNITIQEIRSYCTKCGVKIKTKWSYCPKCGTKKV